MSSYRPPSRDRAHDSYRPPSHGGGGEADEGGFKIRGAASAGTNGRPDRSSGGRRERRKSPYRDPDAPRPQFRGRDRYHDRRDDFRHRPQNDNSYRGYDMSYGDGGFVESAFEEELEEPPAGNGDEDLAKGSDGLQLPFLLVRGLKPNVDEGLLAKGLEKLYLDDNDQELVAATNQPTRQLPPGAVPPIMPSQPAATPASLKRVFLIRDRQTNKSMQYAFAEYHAYGDAKAALKKAEKLGEKCTISSKQVTIDFPHGGIFQPFIPNQSRGDLRFYFELRADQYYTYRDIRYYASPHIVNEEPPSRPREPSPPAAKTGTKRFKNADDGEKVKRTKTSDTVNLEIAQKWSKKQAELRGEDQDIEGSARDSVSSALAGANHDSSTGEPDAQSFVFVGVKDGKNIKGCFLCRINLRDDVDPVDHVKSNPRHQQNLKDEEKYKAGFKHLEKAKIGEDETIKVFREKQEQEPNYRDRAEERREQESKMGTSNGVKIKLSLKEGAQPPRSKGAASDMPLNPPSTANVPTYGMGMSILQRQGYTEGSGLGSGGGISAPIEQTLYSAGVGLGHESSKKGDAIEEANRMTKNDGPTFLEKTKESARERFEKMG